MLWHCHILNVEKNAARKLRFLCQCRRYIVHPRKLCRYITIRRRGGDFTSKNSTYGQVLFVHHSTSSIELKIKRFILLVIHLISAIGTVERFTHCYVVTLAVVVRLRSHHYSHYFKTISQATSGVYVRQLVLLNREIPRIFVSWTILNFLYGIAISDLFPFHSSPKTWLHY